MYLPVRWFVGSYFTIFKKIPFNSEVTPDFPSDTGRIPTPKMRSKSAGARHHLDRTTPVVGGAMLSSPPRPEKKSPVKVSRSWCTPQGTETGLLLMFL